ncbi:MAG: O-antigen ligase family protein [Ferrimonas sp.]
MSNTMGAEQRSPPLLTAMHLPWGWALLLSVMVAVLWWQWSAWALVLGPSFVLVWWLLNDGALAIVVGFVLLSAFRLHELAEPLLSWHLPQIFALATLAVFAWRYWIEQNVRPFWPSESRWLLGLFAATAVGTLVATNSALAQAYLLGSWLKVVVMCFACAWLLQRPYQLQRLACGIVGAGTIVALVALYNQWYGLELVEGSRVTIGRSYGSILGDPNDLALVLLLPFSFALAAVANKPEQMARLWRWAAAICTLLLFMAMLATQSRGGLLGIAAVSATVLHCRYTLPRWVWGLLPLFLLMLMTLAGIAERQSGGVEESGVDESAMGRLYAWQAAWFMMLDHPFFGVGLDNFYVNYFFYSPHWDGRNHAVHSSWLQVLAEVGLPGFLLFVGFYWQLLRRSYRLFRQQLAGATWSLACFAGLVGFGVSSTFLTQAFTWPLYLMASMVWAQWRMQGGIRE